MVNSSNLREKVTFQVQTDGDWQDVRTVYAYMTGLRSSEYWVQFAGGNAEEYLTVSVRYKKDLAKLIPQTSRLLYDGDIYDIISPADDVLKKHRELKFRVRRQIS